MGKAQILTEYKQEHPSDVHDRDLKGGAHGEANPRQCTDLFCLILFLCYLGGMGYVGYIAATRGDIRKLSHGFNWKGELCGVDKNVADKPFLYWCKPEGEQLLQDGVCRTECPTGNFSEHWCPGKSQPWVKSKEVGHHEKEEFYGVKRTLSKKLDIETAEFLHYCLPVGDREFFTQIVEQTALGTKLGKLFTAADQIGKQWELLVGIVIACVVLGYIFLLLIKFIVAPLVYTIALAIWLAMFGGGGYCIFMGFFEPYNFLVGIVSKPEIYAWVSGAIILILAILYTIMLCHGTDAFRTTVHSIQLSCNVIYSMPSLLFQPFVHTVFASVIFAALLYGLATVLSLGDVSSKTQSLEGYDIPMSRTFKFTTEQKWLLAFWIFGMVWVLETLAAAGQFAVAHAVVVKTVCEKRHCFVLVHGYCSALFFHLGSVAFGGFIIGVLAVITWTLAFLARFSKAKDGKVNKIVKCCCICCTCCFACCKQVMEMANQLAYADICIEGCAYHTAIEHVVQMALRNPATFAVVHGCTAIVKYLGVISITGSAAVSTYFLITSQVLQKNINSFVHDSASFLHEHGVVATADVAKSLNEYKDAMSAIAGSSAIATTIIAGCIGLVISLVFMHVFSICSDTLMYCILWKQENGFDHPTPEGWSVAIDAHKEKQKDYQPMKGDE